MTTTLWGRLALAIALNFTASASVAQDAITTAPEHFTLAFENAEVRAIWGRIGPGETTPVILSTRGLNVWFTDAELEIDIQGGPTIRSSQKTEDTQWLSADWQLSLTNLGDSEARWLHFEQVQQAQDSAQTDPIEHSNLPFRLLEPETIENDRSYPLVVFLHGFGERGTDNDSHLAHGIPELLAYARSHDQPMFVLAPQHGETPWHPANLLANESFDFPSTASEPIRQTLDLIEDKIKQHPIDTDRIYLTGLSMGAFGVWDLLLRAPDLFAAALPVAGGAPQDAVFASKSTPVWILHGADDQTVHPDHSVRAYSAARNQGLDVQLSLVPGLHHDQSAWRQMYSDQNVLGWLFDQARE